MKGILVDENVPFNHRFKTSLEVIGSRVLGASPTDTEIWDYAKKNDLVILSKDADFYHRIITSEPPPKVVHLRLGNMGKAEFHRILESAWPAVEDMLENHKLVRVYRSHLEGI